MTRLSAIARWVAVLIAILAVWDPAVRLPRLERPPIRVLPSQAAAAAVLAESLRSAGFTVNATQGEVARVLVSDHASPGDLSSGSVAADAATDASGSKDAPHAVPAVWALDTTPRAPNVALTSVTAPDVRLPGQAIEVRVTIAADGVAGQTSQLVLEDAGVPVATATHAWTSASDRWTTSLQYLPPAAAGGRLRARAIPLPTETTGADNEADLWVPPMRGPVRTLVLEAGVTWPALFTRRALEGEPGFSVSAMQRASKNIVTRAGSPPGALTRAALAPYEVALVGGPDNLSAADLETLRWFVEARGGVAVLVPDQRPTGRYASLAGIDIAAFESRVLDAPLRLRGAAGEVLAAELLVPRSIPSSVRILAATDAGEPIVFAVRRGAGAVIVSGALDAWRYRGRDEDTFARFWRRAILDQAAAVPPGLEVTVTPAVARPGEVVRISARMRASELPAGVDRVDLPRVSAHATAAAPHGDTPVRLWPTAEPGVYEGEWRASSAADYNISIIAGDSRGDAPITVTPAVTHGSASDPGSLALAAGATGGRVFPVDRSSALVDALGAAYPARRVTRTRYPMRSSWWVIPFALLLTGEWISRRRAGLA